MILAGRLLPGGNVRWDMNSKFLIPNTLCLCAFVPFYKENN